MFRLVEASRILRKAVPADLLPVVWGITVLGSATFLVAGLSLGYWNVEHYRDELLALMTVGFAGLAVSLSRVMLGVHYLGDVVAGVGVGLVVLSVPALVATGGNADAALALCATAVRSVVEGVLVAAGVHFLLVTGIVLPMVTGKLDALGPPSRTNW